MTNTIMGALASEIARVAAMREIYKALMALDGANRDPAIARMTAALNEAVAAADSGDALKIVEAHRTLLELEE